MAATRKSTPVRYQKVCSRYSIATPSPFSTSSKLTCLIAPEYFFNYFPYGLSLLFSPSQSHTLQKILLHANLPQSHAFHRFHRLRWKLNPTSSTPPRKKDPTKDGLTSESNFDEIKSCLERFSGPTGNPMIVSRGGQGSPSSSIEFFSDDIRTTSPFGCTGYNSPQLPSLILVELFGFITEGLVFEVIEGGWVGQVTCFKA